MSKMFCIKAPLAPLVCLMHWQKASLFMVELGEDEKIAVFFIQKILLVFSVSFFLGYNDAVKDAVAQRAEKPLSV